MCDPNFETCPENDSSNAPSSTPVVANTGEFQYLYEVQPYTLLWGAATTGMVAYSFWIINMYENDFKEDSIAWVDRTYDASDVVEYDEYDEDWVLQLPELKAWKLAATA